MYFKENYFFQGSDTQFLIEKKVKTHFQSHNTYHPKNKKQFVNHKNNMDKVSLGEHLFFFLLENTK